MRPESVIKLVFCLRRLPHLTQEEFHYYWREKHAPLVRTYAPVTHIQRYVQIYPLDLAELEPLITIRSISTPSFDGIAQLWWNTMEDFVAGGATKAGRDAARLILADEKKFIDLPNSSMFFSREYNVVLDNWYGDPSS